MTPTEVKYVGDLPLYWNKRSAFDFGVLRGLEFPEDIEAEHAKLAEGFKVVDEKTGKVQVKLEAIEPLMTLIYVALKTGHRVEKKKFEMDLDDLYDLMDTDKFQPIVEATFEVLAQNQPTPDEASEAAAAEAKQNGAKRGKPKAD